MQKWKDGVLTKSLAKFQERKSQYLTDAGKTIERLYTPIEIQDQKYVRDLGFPGKFPYTRGVYTTMYRGRLWTMRQYAGFGSAEQTNQRFKYLLNQGQSGLSVAFDFPTQIGLDCDQSLALGEVGKVGVSVSTLKEMELLFSGISLEKITTSMTINAPAAVLLAMYVAIAQEQGISITSLGGTVQNDILKEYVARGMYIYPPEQSMRLVTDILEYCGKHMPRWNTISVSGYHIREAGATSVQEVAFTLANGIAYVEAAIDRGLDVDNFARRISFFFACHNNFLEEIAKFRAARRLWARIMRDRFQAKNPSSWQLRFHTQTSGVALTAQQPQNNIVRVALQALAAVLGGTQSLHTNSFDEAYALPSQKAATIALRTQQIIGHESGVTSIVDPLGGSYCIEALTKQIEEDSTHYIEEIDRQGGAVKAIVKGYMQKEITESAYRFQKSVEEKNSIIVGVNQFIGGQKTPIEILKVNPSVEKRAVQRLNRVKNERSNQKVKIALENLHSAAESESTNLMQPILKAVQSYATIGEICNILRETYGEHRPSTIF